MASTHKIICIDEAHFRRDADKRRCWSPIGEAPIVHVNGSTQNTNVYGAYTLDGKFHYKFVERQLATVTVAFLERLRKIYKKIVFVLESGIWFSILYFPRNGHIESYVDVLGKKRDRHLHISEGFYFFKRVLVCKQVCTRRCYP